MLNDSTQSPHEFVSMNELTLGIPAQISRLKIQLSRQGFALLVLDDQSLTQQLKVGLDEARALKGFRFPPINVSNITYSAAQRETFKALYSIASRCFEQLTDAHVGVEQPELFSSSPNEPFPTSHPFHPTFFNLFNYNHGALNVHQDRGLITVIHISPSTQLSDKYSELWVEGSDQMWRSADEATRQAQVLGLDTVILLVGEAGESTVGCPAAQHCVRVDPRGEYISHSHHQPDPATIAHNNRLSAALILQSKQAESM